MSYAAITCVHVRLIACQMRLYNNVLQLYEEENIREIQESEEESEAPVPRATEEGACCCCRYPDKSMSCKSEKRDFVANTPLDASMSA